MRAKSKTQQCIDHYELLRDPDTSQVEEVAAKVGCSERTAWYALDAYNKEKKKLLALQTASTATTANKKPKFTHGGARTKNRRGGKIAVPLIIKPKIAPGRFDRNAYNKKKSILERGYLGFMAIEFVKFCGYVDGKGVVHEGEAFPPPIDEKGRYLGILSHEVAAFKKIIRRIVRGIMFKWPRGYGKTYVVTWAIQFTMKYLGWPWMHLSSTKVKADVAQWVHKWAKTQHLIVDTTRGDRQNTYTGFELINGAIMRIYDYMSEDMLGQHGFYIVMDDIIKKKWSEKPSENRKAKTQWSYTLNWIKRKGLLIVGTRKFEGDPLQFLEEAVKGLTIEVKTPYKMIGKFPKWSAKIDANTGREILWVPELNTWQELEDKKLMPTDDGTDPLLAWMAEMMQDPRPLEGGNFQKEDLVYVPDLYPYQHKWDVGVVAIDPAFTVGPKSDETGIVLILGRAEGKQREFCVLKAIGTKVEVQRFKDNDGKWQEGMLEIGDNWYQLGQTQFPQCDLWIMPIEDNSGGKIIMQVVANNFDLYECAAAIEPVTHTTVDKLSRINNECYSLIKNAKHGFEKHSRVVFVKSLEGMQLEFQILYFPNGMLIDIMDAFGMGLERANYYIRKTGGLDAKHEAKHYLEVQKKESEMEAWRVKAGLRRPTSRRNTGRSMFD